MERNEKSFVSGFVSLIGRPNVGKSTLLNRLIGEKIAIISEKPQTTRNNALGILTTETMQVVFTDTPGMHTPRTKLGEYMVRSAKEATRDVDAILFLVEPNEKIGHTEQEILASLAMRSIPVILVINKIDTIRRDALLPVITAYTEAFSFAAVIPISAKNDDGVDRVISELEALLPPGPQYYPEDYITDQPERQMAAEIIREKLLRLLDQEVPHGIAIEITRMTEKETITEILATIYCEKASHKGIIIGKNGLMLKKVGRLAREDMERLLDKKVYLELWVKVQPDWRNKNSLIKNFGYE